MAIDTFIAGPYTATFNSADVGITEEGYRISQEASYQEISPSDAYGDTVLDLIYRGGNVFCRYDSKAYKAGSIAAAWPFASLGALGTVGTLMAGAGTPLTKSFVMTRVLTQSTPTSITATRACLAKNFPVELLFDSKLRTVPVRKQFLPSDAAAFFTTA